MLEQLYMPMLAMALVGLFLTIVGAWQFIFNSHKADKISRNLIIISFLTSTVISIVLVVKFTLEGFFLMFLLTPILIILLAIHCYIIGIIFVSLYLLLKSPGSTINSSSRLKPALLAFLGLLIFAVSRSYILKTGSIKQTYGDLGSNDSCFKPLSIQEIETAYSDWFVRNNNWHLRCLLLRKNTPQWIVEDIYKNNKNKEVLSLLLSNPNIGCPMFIELHNLTSIDSFLVVAQRMTKNLSKADENNIAIQNILRCR